MRAATHSCRSHASDAKGAGNRYDVVVRKPVTWKTCRLMGAIHLEFHLIGRDTSVEAVCSTTPGQADNTKPPNRQDEVRLR